MVEFAAILDPILSMFSWKSLFDLDSVQGLGLIVLSGIALIMIGFLIKGIWGAIIAFAVGTIIYIFRLRF